MANRDVTLETLNGGYAPAAFQEELARVMRDIDDPNTSAKAKRSITIEVVFAPDEDRETIAVGIKLKSKISGFRPKLGMITIERRGKEIRAIQPQLELGFPQLVAAGKEGDDGR